MKELEEFAHSKGFDFIQKLVTFNGEDIYSCKINTPGRGFPICIKKENGKVRFLEKRETLSALASIPDEE